MDRREQKRLEDEINRGTLNVGIRKLEEGAYEKESRQPWVKGGSVGLTVGGIIGVAYAQSVDVFHQSPLGLFTNDYVLVMFAIVAAGAAGGAVLANSASKPAPKRGKP